MIALLYDGRVEDTTHQRAKEIARQAGGRFTLIDSSGRVIADSDADSAHMENHAGRPEFLEASKGKRGSAIRRSATTGLDYLYVASPMEGGAAQSRVIARRDTGGGAGGRGVRRAAAASLPEWRYCGALGRLP